MGRDPIPSPTQRNERRLALLLALAVTSAIGVGALRARGAVVAADTLDPAGRALLDPLRDHAIAPEELIARLTIGPRDTVADVGAGPGYLTLPLARAVPGGRVIATDVRADYLTALDARARVARLGQITTRLVTAGHPGLAIGSVDLVVLCQVDHYLSARASFFGELVGSLRPNGRVAIINHARHRAAVEAAAKVAALSLVDAWEPSPGYFTHVYRAPRRTP